MKSTNQQFGPQKSFILGFEPGILRFVNKNVPPDYLCIVIDLPDIKMSAAPPPFDRHHSEQEGHG